MKSQRIKMPPVPLRRAKQSRGSASLNIVVLLVIVGASRLLAGPEFLNQGQYLLQVFVARFSPSLSEHATLIVFGLALIAVGAWSRSKSTKH